METPGEAASEDHIKPLTTTYIFQVQEAARHKKTAEILEIPHCLKKLNRRNK